ncbi:MAG: hypothetical protein ACKPCM_08280, partial [Pseudanabaena sp.]
MGLLQTCILLQCIADSANLSQANALLGKLIIMFNSSLKQPNFRWLWVGQTLIYCAAQFWFVA